MNEGTGEKARRGLRWMAGARLASITLNAIGMVFTVRFLSPGDFGLFAIASVTVGFLGLLNDAGLATSLIRAPTLDEKTVDRTHGLILVINIVVYGLLALVTPWVSSFFGFPDLTLVILVAGLQLFLSGFVAAPSALLQRDLRFPVIATANLAEGMLGGLSTVLMAYLGAGIWAIVLGPMLGSLARIAVVWRQSMRMPRPTPSLEGMAEALRFGGTLTAAQLIWAAYSRADTVIVGRLLGKESLGLYSVAIEIATLPMQKFAGILISVGLANFATTQNDLPTLRERYLWVVRTAAGAAFPLFWGIAAVSTEIANVILGPRWSGVALPLLLISLSVPLRFLSMLTEPVLLAMGRADLMTKNVLVACVIMIPAFFIGSRWGIVGVSAAWAIGYTVFFVYRSAIAVRAMGIRSGLFWRAVTPPALAAASMIFVVAAARVLFARAGLEPIAQTVLLVLAGAASYVGFTWCWNRQLLPDFRRLIGSR